MNLDAVYDANAEGDQGYESGPGLRFTLPIFNGNKGGRAIADAELHRAMRQFVTVRDRVALEVQTAHAEAEQASDNLRVVTGEILPRLDQAVTLATRNYSDGGATYFLVLETTGQFLDARARELELSNALRQTLANLDRSVGYRVAAVPTQPPFVPEMEHDEHDGPTLFPEPDGEVLPAAFQHGGQMQSRSNTNHNPSEATSRGGVLAGAGFIGEFLSPPGQ